MSQWICKVLVHPLGTNVTFLPRNIPVQRKPHNALKMVKITIVFPNNANVL